jgi:Zn-finger nucleic acid-binding protein
MNETSFTRTTSAFRALDTTTALRPARLLCPSCQRDENRESVLESAMSGETEFHRCRHCAGVWFNVKDLDLALNAASHGEWPAPKIAPAGADASKAPVQDSKDEKNWNCPCCGGQLIGIHDRHGAGVGVRRCLVCYGGWIEYPDLLRVGESFGGVLSRLGRAVRGVLPK